jgi:hypothetical protein
MSAVKKLMACAAMTALIAMICSPVQPLGAITYVTDTGGYAYDESRAVTNLAPAIALGTVAIVGIIAIAVQNTHDHSSSSYSGHYGYSSYSDYSSSSNYSSSRSYYYVDCNCHY